MYTSYEYVDISKSLQIDHTRIHRANRCGIRIESDMNLVDSDELNVRSIKTSPTSSLSLNQMIVIVIGL